MTRQYKDGSCSCWKRFEKELDKYGSAFEFAFTITGKHYLEIKTIRTDGKRKPPWRVVCAFCPFCGSELK